MKKILSALSLAVLLASCTKTDVPTPDMPGGNSPVAAQPKSINIDYFNNSNVILQRTSYSFVSSGDVNTSIINVTDSSYFQGSTNMLEVLDYTFTIKMNASSHTFDQVTCQDKKSQLVLFFPDGSVSREEQSRLINNFRADFFPIAPNPVSFYSNVQFYRFDDSLQQVVKGFKNWSSTSAGNDSLRAYHTAAADGLHYRDDEYDVTKDSIKLYVSSDNLATTLPQRYQDYFFTILPWYTPMGLDHEVSYGLLSPFVCTGFTQSSGEYNTVNTGNFTYKIFLVPTLERHVHYKYNADTTALKSILNTLNPGVSNPEWYNLAALRNVGQATNFSENNEISDTFDWTSRTSTDSVFSIDGNGTKLFRQVFNGDNQVEKDAAGRIAKITRRVSGRSIYKVMTLHY